MVGQGVCQREKEGEMVVGGRGEDVGRTEEGQGRTGGGQGVEHVRLEDEHPPSEIGLAVKRKGLIPS